MTTDKEHFEGGVAVITGAGSGIGEGLAIRAAEIGMQVVLADIAEDRLARVADKLAELGAEVLPIRTDVSEPEDLDRLASMTHQQFGDVRLLINNAGIEVLGYSWELSAQEWEQALRINIHGAIHGVRAFVPRMLAAGAPAWIANTSSTGGLAMMPIQTPYILSKHALLSFSECLRLEMQVKRAPISVSAILPGPVATRIFQDSVAADNPLNTRHKAIMHSMVSEGMTSLDAARKIMPQIAAGEFWVSTHPELTAEFAANRAAHLSSLSTPSLSPEVMALLEA